MKEYKDPNDLALEAEVSELMTLLADFMPTAFCDDENEWTVEVIAPIHDALQITVLDSGELPLQVALRTWDRTHAILQEDLVADCWGARVAAAAAKEALYIEGEVYAQMISDQAEIEITGE